MITSLLALAILLGLAFLAVLVRTAISRISQTGLAAIRRESAAGARVLGRVIDDRARHVAVLQLLSLALGAGATVVLTAALLAAGWDEPVALTAAIVAATVLSFIVLGVAPETLGLQHSGLIARRGARPTLVLTALLWPVTRLLVALGNALTPGPGYRAGPFASEAEFRELVDLAGAGAVIEDDERQMIHSVFELSDTLVREVMVPRTEMVWIESGKSLRQGLSLALRSGYSRIPVIGEDIDDVVGVAYLKDLVARAFQDRAAEQHAVVEVMRQAYLVPDSKQVDVLLREMRAARVHLAIVIDEYGGTAGLVTIEDVLEEIVGEISDEYDTGAPEIEWLAEDRCRLSARAHVEDVAAALAVGLDADDEGVDTIAGLMAVRLGRVPIPGSDVRLGDWELVAEAGAGRRNRVASVLATRVGREPVRDARTTSTDRPEAAASQEPAEEL